MPPTATGAFTSDDDSNGRNSAAGSRAKEKKVLTRLRMLMNAQSNDGSPGGAPAEGANTPATSQAEGTPQVVTRDELAQTLQGFKDGFFADLRKSGVFDRAAKGGEPKPSQQQSTPPPADDVQTMLGRERAFNRAISTVRMSDTQFSRMERAFQHEKPDDPSAWVKGYITDLGIGQQADSGGQQSSNPVPQRTGPPASNSGAPAPVTTPSSELEPWRLTDDDVSSLIRQKGFVAAGVELRQRYRQSLSGRRISLKDK